MNSMFTNVGLMESQPAFLAMFRTSLCISSVEVHDVCTSLGLFCARIDRKTSKVRRQRSISGQWVARAHNRRSTARFPVQYTKGMFLCAKRHTCRQGIMMPIYANSVTNRSSSRLVVPYRRKLSPFASYLQF